MCETKDLGYGKNAKTRMNPHTRDLLEKYPICGNKTKVSIDTRRKLEKTVGGEMNENRSLDFLYAKRNLSLYRWEHFSKSFFKFTTCAVSLHFLSENGA